MKAKQFNFAQMRRRGPGNIHETVKGMHVNQHVESWRQRADMFSHEHGRSGRTSAGKLH